MRYPTIHFIFSLVLLAACSKETFKPAEDSKATVNPAVQKQEKQVKDTGGPAIRPEQITKIDENWRGLLMNEQRAVDV
jgi:hypothetical protein